MSVTVELFLSFMTFVGMFGLVCVIGWEVESHLVRGRVMAIPAAFNDVVFTAESETDGQRWDRPHVHGAAYSSVIRKLERLMAENDYEQFNRTHNLVYEPGRCAKGLHNYCGCGIHQAWCPCMYDWRDDPESGLP